MERAVKRRIIGPFDDPCHHDPDPSIATEVWVQANNVASPIHLECLYHQTVELPCDIPGSRNALELGRGVGIHISDDVLTDGQVDMTKFVPIARLGYMDYTKAETVFTMERPGA